MITTHTPLPIRNFLASPIFQFCKDLYHEISEDQIFTGAAALSYYLLFAIFPGMIFLLTLLPYLPIENLQQVAMSFFREVLPGNAAETVQGVVLEITTQKRSGLLSFGLLLTLWSASTGLAAVMDELNATYDVRETRPFWKTRSIALLLTVFFALLTIGCSVSIVFGAFLQHWLEQRFHLPPETALIFTAFRWGVAITLSLSAFAVVYYFGPDVEQRVRFIAPGAVVGTGLLALASLAFRFYVQNFANYTASYGSLGAVIVLMLWLYIAGVIIMVGSELNSLVEHYSPNGKSKGERRLPTESKSSVVKRVGGRLRSETPNHAKRPDFTPAT